MFSQMEELKITTLGNGVKVINLMKSMTFDCGTFVENSGSMEVIMKNKNMTRDYDFDKEVVSEVVGKELVEQGLFKLRKRIVVPRIDEFHELKKHLPKDCIILVREYVAESWGFPFVYPVFDTHKRQYRSDCFVGV